MIQSPFINILNQSHYIKNKMGQIPIHGMREVLPTQMAILTEKLIRNASEIKQTATLNYEKFIDSITVLNEIIQSFSDINGKQLVFRVKTGTDGSVFWRGLVRIKCHKVNSRTGAIESTRLLTLKQYIHLYNEISLQASSATLQRQDILCEESAQGCIQDLGNCLDASVLLLGIDEVGKDGPGEEECIICMDRKAQIILPCSHSYCEECIDAWQCSHKNCPICRATVKGGEDSWVLSEKPDEHEMAYETTGYLMGLVDRQSTAADPDTDTE